MGWGLFGAPESVEGICFILASDKIRNYVYTYQHPTTGPCHFSVSTVSKSPKRRPVKGIVSKGGHYCTHLIYIYVYILYIDR